MSAKQQVQDVLSSLPDDCSIEDVQYHLYVADKIRRRMTMSQAAAMIPQAEVEKKFEKWLTR